MLAFTVQSNLQFDLQVAPFFSASLGFDLAPTQKSQGASHTQLLRFHVLGFAVLALSGVPYVLGGRTDSGDSK